MSLRIKNHFMGLIMLFVLLVVIFKPQPTLALSSGNLVWAKSMGGVYSSMTVDNNGNIYITGGFQDTVDFDPGAGIYSLTSTGGYDIFVSKLDNNGNLIWVKSMGEASNEFAEGITVDNKGNIYTTGLFYLSTDMDPGDGIFELTTAGMSIFVSKLDKDGNFVWAKNLGGESYRGDATGFAITVDSNCKGPRHREQLWV